MNPNQRIQIKKILDSEFLKNEITDPREQYDYDPLFGNALLRGL